VFRVMLAGQPFADAPELQRRDGEAFSLDAGDDLTYQVPLDGVGLDQYQGPFGHGGQRT
jgi:hypothetical protein